MRTIEDTKPWYRQFWPWALMVMPATAVVAGLYTYSLAASNRDGLVVDDYYKEGKAINRSLERGKLAAQMGLIGDLSIHGEKVQLLLNNPKLEAEQQLQLKLSHATIEGHDQSIALHKTGTGVWEGQIQTLAAGKWFVDLLPLGESWRLTGSMADASVQSLKLEPAL
jgi:hypothetical protein